MRIRTAERSDSEVIARIHVGTWRTTYRGLMPDPVLDGLSVVQRLAQRERDFADPDYGRRFIVHVAEMPAAGVVGFGICGAERRGGERFDAEIYAIYVQHDVQGKGVGRALLAEQANWLWLQGWQSLLIWVLEGNPAARFYERLGGHAACEQIGEFGGRPLREVGYTWPDMRSLMTAGRP